MCRKARSSNDALSKNISMVLEDLLQDYESSQFPEHNTGKIK